MANVDFIHDHSLVPGAELGEVAETLQPEIERMNAASLSGYEDDRASINLSVDSDMLGEVETLIGEKLKLKPEYVIVAGIGGSNLGTIAVQEAVLGKLYNQLNPKIKVLYADTVDTDLIDAIITLIEPVLARGGNVIINGVSKSGETTETIANFEVLVELLKRYKKENYQDYAVVTTDRGSKFWHFAKEQGFNVLEIPGKVGGRYSVLSPVGLFPLGFLGIELEKLVDGAAAMRKWCLERAILKNPAALSAALIYHHYLTGRNIYNLFLFANDLESVGKWYRQLMGESIGKQFNRRGEAVYTGITPTVAVGSTDLHSMAQLYLGGPQDTYTTFVKVEKPYAEVSIPHLTEYSRLVKGIQGRKLAEIMDAIYRGVKTAYIKGRRPFSELILPDKSEHSIGQLLQLKLMEMMYLGFLLEVNPFDQPNVIAYKMETRKILEGEE